MGNGDSTSCNNSNHSNMNSNNNSNNNNNKSNSGGAVPGEQPSITEPAEATATAAPLPTTTATSSMTTSNNASVVAVGTEYVEVMNAHHPYDSYSVNREHIVGLLRSASDAMHVLAAAGMDPLQAFHYHSAHPMCSVMDEWTGEEVGVLCKWCSSGSPSHSEIDFAAASRCIKTKDAKQVHLH